LDSLPFDGSTFSIILFIVATSNFALAHSSITAYDRRFLRLPIGKSGRTRRYRGGGVGVRQTRSKSI